MKELEVNLVDVILKLLLKWRTILVSIFIVGAVGAIFGAIGSSQTKGPSQSESTVVTVDSLKEELTEEEQEGVLLVVENYQNLEEMLEVKEEHNSHSIMSQIDYNNAPSIRMTYHIATNKQAIYPVMSIKNDTNNVIELYVKKVLNSDTYNYISKEMGWDIDTRCVHELISLERGTDELFTIVIVARNEGECAEMASIIKSKINEAIPLVNDVYAEYDITLVDEIYNETYNENILTYKKEKKDELSAIKNEMLNIKTMLNEKQLKYYDALINGIPETDTALKDIEQKESNTNTRSAVNIKYIVLGSVFGAVLSLVYVLAQYLFSSTLRNDKDILALTNRQIFGNVYEENEKKKILSVVDKFIYRLFGVSDIGEKSNAKEMILSNIRISMKKKNLKKVYLISSCNDKNVENVLNGLAQKIQNESYEAIVAIDILRNVEKLEEILMAECVVIVEKENTSKYADIKKLVEVCEMHQVTVLGNVVVKEV